MSDFSFNSLLRQMAEKCSGYTEAATSVSEKKPKEESVEPKKEENEEFDEVADDETNMEEKGSEGQLTIVEAHEEQEDLKVEAKNEPIEASDTIITPQTVDDLPIKVAAPPPGMRRIVIKSNGNAVYSATTASSNDDDGSWRPRYPVHIVDKANDFCHRYEREMGPQTSRNMYTSSFPTYVHPYIRKPLPNILRSNRPLPAGNVVVRRSPYYLTPPIPTRGAANIPYRERSKDNIAYGMNGTPVAKPDWTYPNMIALCILCSENGYVSTPELYEFIEHYFPYYGTAQQRWYRSSLRNALSRFCDKYMPEKNGHRSTSWTLRESRMQIFKNEINRFIKREHSGRGVHDFENMIASIQWNRPAVIAEHEATNPRVYRDKRGNTTGDFNVMSAQQRATNGGSPSGSREETPEDEMFKAVDYYDSDNEYMVDDLEGEIINAHDFEKPEWKHPHMLAIALVSFSDGCGTVQELYDFIGHYFPYYSTTDYWKSSARNSLCNSKYFTKYQDERHNVTTRSCLYKIREDQLETAIKDLIRWMEDPVAEVGVNGFDSLKNFVESRKLNSLDQNILRLQPGGKIIRTVQPSGEIVDVKIE